MKKVVCCLSTLLIVLLLAGCTFADIEATDRAARSLAIVTGKSKGDFYGTAKRVNNRMCEGEQVAVAMMLGNAGLNSDLDSYDSLWVVEMIDDEGNRYRLLYINERSQLVGMDRYRN